MGMSVVQLPGGEIQPAMKSGLIDAAEFNNPTSDRDFGMQDVSKFYHLASFHQSQECFEVTFNKDKFNALSPEHQAIIRNASMAENSASTGATPSAILTTSSSCRSRTASTSSARPTA
jgi:TRAP-type mannitol/chloroaromatic compound transport system substrate-binding protein